MAAWVIGSELGKNAFCHHPPQHYKEKIKSAAPEEYDGKVCIDGRTITNLGPVVQN